MSRLEIEPFREPLWLSRRERPQEPGRISRCMNYTPCRGRPSSTIAPSLNPRAKVNGVSNGTRKNCRGTRRAIPAVLPGANKVWALFCGTIPRKHEILYSARVAEKSFAQTSRPSSKPLVRAPRRFFDGREQNTVCRALHSIVAVAQSIAVALTEEPRFMSSC